MGMNADAWDERYKEWEYVWSLQPNRFVQQEVEAAGLREGRGRRALDWACGEGRNAVWLAENGWRVTAVDYSAVGLAKTERLAADRGVQQRVSALEADVTVYEPPQVFDLVVMSYLQLPETERRRAVAAASRALRPGGTMIVVAHDSANLERGSGGPKDPAVLYTPDALEADLRACGVPWAALQGSTRERTVEEAERPALDTVVTAQRAGRVVEVFADIGCPFTHVGLRRFVQARARRGEPEVVLHVRAWPLEVVNAKPLDAEFIGEEVEDLRASVAPGEFAGFRLESFPPSGLPAMALAAQAYDEGVEVGEAVSLELRDLLFEQGEPIGAGRLLAEVAVRHGIAFDPPSGRRAVLADHAEGVERGVIGSPHFFTPTGDFFCPALDISRDEEGHLHVRMDEAGFQEFLDSCFEQSEADQAAGSGT